MGPPGSRVIACSAPLKMAPAPACMTALKGCPGGAVTRGALAEAETPVLGPPVPILVVMLDAPWLVDALSSVARAASCEKTDQAPRTGATGQPDAACYRQPAMSSCVLHVVGTRPNFMKMAPLVRALWSQRGSEPWDGKAGKRGAAAIRGFSS
jgi:hypothetical protein